MNLRRSRPVLAVAASALLLAACTSSPPPSNEIAEEIIDSLVVQEGLSTEVADCMKQELADFELTEAELEGFSDLDEVAAKAADDQPQALEIMERFQDALASCRTSG